MHAAVSKMFGHLALDGEIWYLSLNIARLSILLSFFPLFLLSALLRNILLLRLIINYIKQGVAGDISMSRSSYSTQR